MTPIFHLSNHT